MVYRMTHAIRSTTGFRHLAAVVIVAGMFTVAPVNANATVLVPGGFVAPTLDNGPTGALIASMTDPFDTGAVQGTFLSAVYQLGAFYDFYYQVVVSSATPVTGVISSVSAFPFPAAVTTDATYRTVAVPDFVAPTAGVIPNFAFRDFGGTVTFAFLNTIGVGENSAIMVLRTNSPFFGTGVGGVSGAGGDTAATFAPVAPIPEPGSLLLLGSGLAALASMARLRQRKNRANV
jgi:hypothetical protein